MRGVNYFVTLCTRERQSGLHAERVGHRLREEIQALEQDQSIHLHAAVIMPDHVHLLFRLSGPLALGQVVARFKSKTSTALKSGSLGWQTNYYDRRLRTTDPFEYVILYLFLKP